MCGRKRVVVRTDKEHAISALSTTVCHARTEETILENSPSHSPACMGEIEIVNRLLEGPIRTIRGRLEQLLKIETNITDPVDPRVVRHASWLLNWYRVKLDVYPSCHVSKGRPYGGKVVELGEQVDRNVPGMMQKKCGGHLRPGTWLCKVEGLTQTLSQTPKECTLKRADGQRLGWEMLPRS